MSPTARSLCTRPLLARTDAQRGALRGEGSHCVSGVSAVARAGAVHTRHRARASSEGASPELGRFPSALKLPYSPMCKMDNCLVSGQ